MSTTDLFREFLREPSHENYVRFVTGYIDPVYRVARRVLRSPDLADDVVQEVFLRLGRAEVSADSLISSRAYVLRTAYRVAIDESRRRDVRERREREAAATRPQVAVSPERRAIEREELARLHSALDTLPSEFRVALHLYAFEELSYEEIARVTGVTEGTVASRIHRARCELERRVGTRALSLLAAAAESGAGARLGGRCCRLFPRSEASIVARLLPSTAGFAGLVLVIIPVAAWFLSPTKSPSLGVPKPHLARAKDDPSTGELAPNSEADEGVTHAESSRSLSHVPLLSSHGDTTMQRANPSRARTARFATTLAVAMGLPATAAEPGDLIEIVPSPCPAPYDVAAGLDGQLWVTSFQDAHVCRLEAGITEVLDALPLPFEYPLLSGASGIAFDPEEGLLWVIDTPGGRIVELESANGFVRQGIPVPLVANPGNRFASGLAYDPRGDDGAGSLLVVPTMDAIVHEISRSGELIRSFPPDEPDRLPGSAEAQLFDVDPIVENGRTAGYYVLGRFGVRRSILRLDPSGRWTGSSVSLGALGEQMTSLLQRSYVDPLSGEARDSFLAPVFGSRFAWIEGGDAQIQDLVGVACELNQREVSIEWTRQQVYDAIEVRIDDESTVVLPGDADSWRGELHLDGSFRIQVVAVEGVQVARSEPCEVTVGPGQQIRASKSFRGTTSYGADLAIGPEGSVAVLLGDDRRIRLFSPDLEPIGSMEVSAFFVAGMERLRGLAWGADSDSMYVANDERQIIGVLDRAGEVLDEINFPPMPEGQLKGMAYRLAGDDGRGSLLLLHASRDPRRWIVYEIDRGGRLLSEFAHPFDPEVGCPEESASAGIAVVRGAESERVLFGLNEPSSLTSRGRFGASLTRLPRRWITEMGFDGSIRGESAFPLPRSVLTWCAARRVADRTRLYAIVQLASERVEIVELETARSSLPAPLWPAAAVSTEDDVTVDLSFDRGISFDEVDVMRDGELIATLERGMHSFRDRTPGDDGVRTYRFRGIAGERTSASAEVAVRVGVGAVLDEALTCPLYGPQSLARNPADGSIFLASTSRPGWSRVARFSESFEFLDWIGDDMLPPDQILSMAVRLNESGGPELFYVVWNGGLSALYRGGLSTAAELVEASFVRAENGRSAVYGLTWDPVTDTFFYQEVISNTIAQMRPDGSTLRAFPNPVPPAVFSARDVGLAVWTERGTLLIATARSDEPTISRAVELTVEGTPTGFEIPLPAGPRAGDAATGFAVSGNSLYVAGSWNGPRLLRLLAEGARKRRSRAVRSWRRRLQW